jgi:cytidyltransferase-like protein
MIGGSAAPFRAAHKIVSLEGLSALRDQFPDRSIVLCHGAFDLVHMGHLIHFEDARALGDILVVTITADRHITKKRSVSFSEEYRARQLAALEIVDYVAVIDEPSAVTPIERLRPDVYVKGPEYANLVLDKTANIFREKALIERLGGRMHFTNGATFSSTKLAHFLLAAPEASQTDPLLSNDRVLFRDLSALGFRLEQLKSFLAGASQLRVCVIGETIIDEWVDVRLTNLSQKSRCVAGLETARCRQVGGAGAVALHLATFVTQVDCYTNAPPEPWPANVRATAVADDQLVKTRFVDRDTGFRLFESKSADLQRIRHDALPDFDDYDVVLIADFGHGLVDPAVVNRRIAGRQRAFVTAMAQANSSNYGYNLPTKFVGLDYCSVNRTEAELCLRERGLPLPELIERIGRLLDVPALSVTDGELGAMVMQQGTSFAIPTVSVSVVDTVGCGDAYFALSSLAAAMRCPPGVVALAGSIGAAAVAQRRGNESATSDQEFLTIGKIVI